MTDYKFIVKRFFRTLAYSINPRFVKPRDICLCVTNRCNSRCSTCLSWRMKSRDESTEVLKGWLRQFREYGIYGLTFSGGEPTMRKDIYELIEYAHDLGFGVHMGTNAIKVLNPVPRHLDGVSVSIDGATRETYLKLRGVDNFENAWKAVDYYRASGLKVYVNFVMSAENYLELPRFLELCREHEVKANILPINLGGYIQTRDKKYMQFDAVELARITAEILSNYMDAITNSPDFLILVLSKIVKPFPHPCPVTRIRFIVGADGGIYPCSKFPKPFGNLKQKPFAKILEENERFLNRIALEECPISRNCISQEIDSCIREKFGYYFKLLADRGVEKLRGMSR